MNPDEEIVPSTKNDWDAEFGEFVTWMEQLSVPCVSVLQEPTVKMTAEGFCAVTVGCASLAAKPVPDPTSVVGSVATPTVNVQDGTAVNAFVEVTVFVPSFAVNVCAVSGAAVIVSGHAVNVPVASVEQAPNVNVTTVAPFVAAKVTVWLALKP